MSFAPHLTTEYRLCVSCLSQIAEPGDLYCHPCRNMIDRAAPDDQLSWPGLLPAETDAPYVPGQLDLADALTTEGDATP